MEWSWSNKKVIHLIQAYQAMPNLWNTCDPHYKNRHKRKDAWDKLAQIMNCPDPKEVERKVHNLRGQYKREQDKLSRREKYGSGASSVDETNSRRWFAYKYFKFLESAKLPQPKMDLPEKWQEPAMAMDESLTKFSTEDQGYEAEKESLIKCDEKQQTKKVKKKRALEKDKELLEEAYTTMKRFKESKEKTDEFSIYGENVAVKLRKLKSSTAVSVLQYIINTAIFEAEMGLYNTSDRPLGLAQNVLRSSSVLTTVPRSFQGPSELHYPPLM